MSENWLIRFIPVDPMIVDEPIVFRGEWEKAVDFADTHRPKYPTTEIILEFGFTQ